MTTIILHDYWRSTASYRVRLVLNLKKVDFELRSVDLLGGEHKQDDYMDQNPMGLVPTLSIGDLHLTQKNIRQALEGSLKRLQTDYVDLYQIHWPDRKVNNFGQKGYESDWEVGGMYWPKHFGQSGQPIPEPVILTTEPAKKIR